MELSKDLKYSLPADVNPNRVSQHVKLRGGLESPMGESHLVLADGQLVLLTRNRPTHEYTVYRATASEHPFLRDADDVLIVPQPEGSLKLPIPSAEVGPVAFLLQRLQAEATFPPTAEEEPEHVPSPRNLPPLEPDQPLDSAITHPEELRVQLALAIQRRQWLRASGICDRLAETSLLYAPEAQDAKAIIVALKEGDLLEAFLRTDFSDTALFDAKDALLVAVSDAFAAREQAVWAVASRLASVEGQDETILAGLFRALGKDFSREEHVDEVIDQFERERSTEIGKRIMEHRTKPMWRELRARVACRRGGHAMAMRELRLLAERFPGVVTIDTAFLRSLHEAPHPDRCQQLLIRCADEYEDPKDTVRILRCCESAGIPMYAVASAARRLQVAHRGDTLLMNWIAELPLRKPKNWAGVAAVAGALAAVACAAAAYAVWGP